MKKRNLAPYLLLSFFVHASLLIGAYKFQRLPPEKTPVDLIPVEIIVLREEPLIPQLVPVMSEPKLTRKAVKTKSQVSIHRRMDLNMDDFAELSPKENRFEPSLNIDRFPALNIVQKSRKEEKAGSKSMISIFQQPPFRLSPVDLSAPDRSPAIELEMPSVRSMAELEEAQTYPRTSAPIPVKTKSRVSIHRWMDLNMDDFAELSPKENRFEPSLNIDRFPALNIVQKSRKEEKAGSKSMISIFQQPPFRLSPVNLSAPDRSPAIELEMPSVPSMAELEEAQTYPRTSAPIPVKTKSRVSIHRWMDLNMDDFAELSPKESRFEPSLNIDRFPALNIVQKSRKEEKAGSKSMISIFQQPPFRLSPVNLSAPDRSPAIELEMPSVLSMAEIEEVQTYPRTLKKTGLPLKKTRMDVDFVTEVQSIPNIESPSIPDHRKMVLAVPGDYSLETVAGFETKVRHKSVLLPDVRVALKKESTDDLKPMIPVNEPAPFNLKILSFFSFLGSAKGAAYLFVVDTSGSIKGAPLDGIKKSAREFVSLMGANDRAGIMTFDDSSVLVAPFTSIKEPLREEIDKLRIAGNQTVLFDALMKANRFISKEDRQNRFIVLFSDGKDEGSQFTLDKVIEETRRSGVPILSVAYSRVEREYLSIMRKLAEKTGGAFVNAPQFHDILILYRASRDTFTEDPKAKTTVHALLKIKSHPIGAQVFVDGESKGKTPLDLALPFGTHEVRLTLPDYYDWEAQVKLRKEGETPIRVRLLPVEEKLKPKKSLKKET